MELANVAFELRPNRRRFLASIDINPNLTVSADLTHSNAIAVANQNSGGKTFEKTDALMTNQQGLFLTLTVADCFPVYFFDTKQNIIGLAHCGWRGTVAGLAAKMVSKMKTNPKNILVGIGPGIHSCHFEIQKDILPQFKVYPEAVTYREGKIFASLVKIISSQLKGAGVPLKNIESLGECTACFPGKYFSYRRDKPKNIEAMLAFIGLA